MANTSNKAESSPNRVVKVALPVDLIRRMDHAIMARQGGFETRAELIRESIHNLLVELEHPEAPPEPGSGMHPDPGKESAQLDRSGTGASVQDTLPNEILDALPPWERDEVLVRDLAGTGLVPPSTPPALVTEGEAKVTRGPFIGLHNRDYVSLWAAGRLARYTQDGLIPFDQFLSRATAAAWVFADSLTGLEQSSGGGTRLTVLLPTNLEKRQAAERGFQHFAIGTIPRGPAVEQLRASGPLFAWCVCQLERRAEQIFVGLTPQGWQLVTSLAGISLEMPHSPNFAEKFFSHLAQHASADLWGFQQVVSAIVQGPDREALVQSFSGSHADWTPAMRSSITQGYIARAREWGLVEPRMIDGRYRLTQFGDSVLDRGLMTTSTKEH